MDLITFMSMVILVVTVVTLAFGIIAYILYKVRESNKRKIKNVSYEDTVVELNDEFIFFER